MQKGDLAAAVEVLGELARRAPSDAAAAYNLGLALKQKDDFAAAEAELRRAVGLDASLPESVYTLGVVLWQTGAHRRGGGAVPGRDRAEARLSGGPLHARDGAQAAGSVGGRAGRVPREACGSAPATPRRT
jgi:tetratricopeptide (TPR) repeat protein